MSTTRENGDELLSMLDSIDEVMNADSWSNLPPPPIEIVVDEPAPHETAIDASSVASIDERRSPTSDIRAAVPSHEEPRPFGNMSASRRRYPDAPPSPALSGRPVRGSTRDILALFKWGEP